MTIPSVNQQKGNWANRYISMWREQTQLSISSNNAGFLRDKSDNHNPKDGNYWLQKKHKNNCHFRKKDGHGYLRVNKEKRCLQ